MARRLALPLMLAAALGCATAPPPAPPVEEPPHPEAEAAPAVEEPAPPAPPPLPEVVLAPLWQTVPRPQEGFAGLAVWPGAGQRPWLLVAARASHRLVLFDAATGELLRELGSLGDRPGQFREPVDVAVAGDLAFVAERGNARVQVLRLPGLATVGFLGAGELARPAAVAVEPAGEGWAVWVAEEGIAGGVAEPASPAAGASIGADGVGPANGSTREESGGSDVAAGGTGGGRPATEVGLDAPRPAVIVVHRFEVSAEGLTVTDRRFEVPIAASVARLATLAIASGAGALAALAPPPPEPTILTAEPPAMAAPEATVAPVASFDELGELPLAVWSGAVTGATHLACGDGAGSWLLSLEAGSLLALDAAGTATPRLTVTDAAGPSALAALPQPLPGLPAGALYAVTSAGTLLAIDAAAAAAAVCP